MEDIIKNKLDNYSKKLINDYLSGGSESKRRRLAGDLYIFSALYSELCEDKEFIWDKDYTYYKYEYEINKKFVEYIDNNTKELNEITDGVLNTYKEINYNFYNNYYKKLQKLSDQDIYELILGFINSFDQDTLNKFYNKIKNREIFVSRMDMCDGGYIRTIDSIGKNYIFLNRLTCNNIVGATSLAHELGHAYELELLYKCDKKDFNYVNMSTPYYEISSSFFEYAFLKYLKENRILLDDVNYELASFYINLFSFNYEGNIITKMPSDALIDEYGMITLDDHELMNKYEKLKEELNYYSLPSLDDKVVFRHPFIYGIGELLAVNMYDIYKKDPIYFKKNFNRLLHNYRISKDLSFTNNIGLTKEDLVKNKVLKRELKELQNN